MLNVVGMIRNVVKKNAKNPRKITNVTNVAFFSPTFF